ncbi:MAG TPA: hypothetical protein VHO69_18560 [Phototrophicaceae bacterium]|nr:hypothetical protein [Phototrophicaceae bacterium]
MHRRSGLILAGLMVVIGLAFLLSQPFSANAQECISTSSVVRVSVASDGTQANGASSVPLVSGDGRYVAFWSDASNLVADDTNGISDLFVHDRQTGQTTRVMVFSDYGLYNLSLSANGHYLVFESYDPNLVPSDTNETSDVFVYDWQTQAIERVSVASNGAEGNTNSIFPSISSDGRYVTFWAADSNLVPNDTNEAADIFVHDRQTGQTVRVPANSLDSMAHFQANFPRMISADARYVAFSTLADNLVAGDTNEMQDVFRYDLQTQQAVRVSVKPDGSQRIGNSTFLGMSADGRYIVMSSGDDVYGILELYWHDMETGETQRVDVASDGTPANDGATFINLSDDGRYVYFESWATNLIPGDSSYTSDIFAHDLQTGQTTRLFSGSNFYSSGLVVSNDGRYMAFSWQADNLILSDNNQVADIFVGSIEPAATCFAFARTNTPTYTLTPSNTPTITPSPTPTFTPIPVSYCAAQPPITWMPMGVNGVQPNKVSYAGTPALSADGRYIAFSSYASNLVASDTNNDMDVFRYDRQSGQTTLVSVAASGAQAVGLSGHASISADGRYIAFESDASNLVANDTTVGRSEDVFIRDMETGQITLVSQGITGMPVSGYSPQISANGRYVVFISKATNLIEGDTNNQIDVFVRDLQTGEVSRVSVSSNGTQADGMSYPPSISGDGRYITFMSVATNLTLGDWNNLSDIFLHDRETKQTKMVNFGGGTSSDHPQISANGRYIVYETWTSKIVAGQRRYAYIIYLYDRLTTRTKEVSITPDGSFPDGNSLYATISSNGRYIAFYSEATNLLLGDTNQKSDLFVYDQLMGKMARLSIAADGTQANNSSYDASFGAYGAVVFDSSASNLVSNDTNNTSDLFFISDVNCLLQANELSPTEEATPEITPTIEVTPEATATSEVTPEATTTAEATPEATATVEVTPEVTAVVTLEMTPEVTATAEVTPEVTPTVAPTSLPNAVPQIHVFTQQPITLTWNRITWAAQYHLQVDTDKAFGNAQDFTTLDAATLEWQISNLSPNTYHWRVQALDANGKAGGWSAVESFTIGWP